MPQSNTRDLAEKIARILESESRPPDISSVLSGIEKLTERLDKIESQLASPAVLIQPSAAHPSQSRFSVIEAIADQYFAGDDHEKICTFEPNAKPCDHCSMCSSRGF